MNPFKIGDRVQYKAKSRRNGTVIAIMCGICEKCKATPRNYAMCIGDEKNKVSVSYADSSKRSKYDYTELELELPLPLKSNPKVFDWSPPDIRPLGDVRISVPLIVSDDEEEADDTVVPDKLEQTIIEPIKRLDNKTTLDEFLMFRRMERPI